VVRDFLAAFGVKGRGVTHISGRPARRSRRPS